MDSSQTFMHDLVVVLPAKNEALTIRESISRFSLCLPNAHIVVVDNDSTDRTALIAMQTIESLEINGQVINEPKAGKGNAIWAGLHAAQAAVYAVSYTHLTLPTIYSV